MRDFALAAHLSGVRSVIALKLKLFASPSSENLMAGPNHKALVVGVSKYRTNSRSWLDDLPSVATDAKEVTKVLSTKKYGAIVKKEHAVALVNRNATKEKIIKALKSTMNAAKSATVVVYFGGHLSLIHI